MDIINIALGMASKYQSQNWDDFLAKPVRLEELAQALRGYLPLSTAAR